MPGSTNDLTLEEQIGQLMMVGFAGTTPTPQLIALIERYHVGNIILFSRNVQSAQQLRTLTDELQAIARQAGQRYPLLIAIDQENGMIQRLGDDATIFPGSMALGAIGSESSAYEVAQAAGRELRALGVNFNLAPVVDVNNNPANPVIGVRSFGENPRQVARLASAQVQGYHNAGIATCLKHFPGHGDTATDSHLAMPVVPHSLERLESLELVPFIDGIAAGTDSIMLAHIYFSALMGNSTLPATLSPEVVQQLLRGKLNFQGVIITDCLEMNAVSETVGVGRGAVMAHQAGNDLILISHRYDRQVAGIEALKAAVQAGSIDPSTIARAVERILAMKQRLSEREEPAEETNLSIVGSQAHQELSRQIYEQSTTLVRDEQHLLPLHLPEDEHLLVVYTHRDTWTMAEDKGYPEKFLVEQVYLRHKNTSAIVLTQETSEEAYEQLYQAASAASTILMVTVNALLDPQQVRVMQRLLQIGKPIIGLAPYMPYDLLAFPELGTYLVTYEYTRPAIASAMRVLFGEIEARGKLPISLPGLYPLSV